MKTLKQNEPVAILDQFKENGMTITYMTSYLKEFDDGRMPKSHAVFKIRLKRNFTLLERIFPSHYLGRVLGLGRKLIANQINNGL